MNLSAYHNYPANPSPYIDGQCSTTINPVYNKAYSAMGSEFDARNFHDYVDNRIYGEDVGDAGEEFGAKVVYSTQSLDRRKTNKLSYSRSFKDEVILRPITSRPFEYLHRPGSTLELTGVAGAGGVQPAYRLYGTRTLPRDFENRSSTQSIRDVAL